jgi:transcriptional regulator with XRE-family HTH domain
MPTATSIAELLRLCRGDLAISQRELAGLAGISSARISAYESGKRQPTIAGANEVLRALGLQLVLSTEPADADLDRRIEELASRSLGQRLLAIKPHVAAVLDLLEDAAPILDGAAAALVHGAPVPVEFTDLVIDRDKVDVVADRFAWLPPVRWSAEHGRYLTGIPVDPRVEGSMRWRSSWGELRITFTDELPPSVVVRVPSVGEVGFEFDLRVVAINRIGALDKNVARLVDRVIERSRARSP